MKRLHILFSLSSLAVVLVSIERFSFTTHILLQPYSFLRLHEAIQIVVLILATVIIPFFLFKEVTHDFSLLTKTKKNVLLGVLFITGIYFYASGNALHELASFLFNQYCDVTQVSGQLCAGLFFNDYYTGNVLYFIGAFFMNIALILFEIAQPRFLLTRRDILLILPNSLIYALAIVAYAGFDRVIVGLVYSLLTTLIVVSILFIHRKEVLRLPITNYTALTYTIGTVLACIVRFH
ncbi:MAG: hypothetical protein JOZ18_08895 [Chloroflexi bacterium]|nr:hypothetical protein [Chloroflexota bacterium]